jgi:hypothetical protein
MEPHTKTSGKDLGHTSNTSVKEPVSTPASIRYEKQILISSVVTAAYVSLDCIMLDI